MTVPQREHAEVLPECPECPLALHITTRISNNTTVADAKSESTVLAVRSDRSTMPPARSLSVVCDGATDSDLVLRLLEHPHRTLNAVAED
jgi:hypothetical protein